MPLTLEIAKMKRNLNHIVNKWISVEINHGWAGPGGGWGGEPMGGGGDVGNRASSGSRNFRQRGYTNKKYKRPHSAAILLWLFLEDREGACLFALPMDPPLGSRCNTLVNCNGYCPINFLHVKVILGWLKMSPENTKRSVLFMKRIDLYWEQSCTRQSAKGG